MGKIDILTRADLIEALREMEQDYIRSSNYTHDSLDVLRLRAQINVCNDLATRLASPSEGEGESK